MENTNFVDYSLRENHKNSSSSSDTIGDGTNINGGINFPQKGTIIGTSEIPPSVKNYPPLSGFLVSYSRSKSGDSFILREGNNGIGKGKNNSIKLAEHHISNDHAKINVSFDNELNQWRYQIVDLSSTNGTILNGIKLDIYSGQKLKNNDILKIGEYTFLVLIIDLNLLPHEVNQNFVEQQALPELEDYSRLPDSNSTNVGI